MLQTVCKTPQSEDFMLDALWTLKDAEGQRGKQLDTPSPRRAYRTAKNARRSGF